MDLPNSFGGLNTETSLCSPRSHQQQRQLSKNPNPLKLEEIKEAQSKIAIEMLECPLSSPGLHQQQQQASMEDPNPDPTHRQAIKSRKSRGAKCSNPHFSPRSHQQKQQPFENPSPNVPTPDEIQKAFQSAMTADEMLEVFLHMASFNVAVMFLHVEGKDPKKILSFASRAVNNLDKDEKFSLYVAIALQLKGSATYSLNRYDESLSCFNRANRILGRLEEQGLNMNCIRPLLHKVHRELAMVNMAKGRMGHAFQSLRKCLELTEMNLDEPGEVGDANYDLADAYVEVLNYQDALPFCLKALAIHMYQLGKNSEKVQQDRLLITRIYTELFEYEKALEHNELLQMIFKDLGLSIDLLRREIDAADLKVWLGKYDEALVILKRALQKSDKESEIQAQILIAMANALFKQEKLMDVERCLNTAGGILEKGKMEKTIKVAEALGRMGMIYVTMKEYKLAIPLFKRMLAILEKHPREVKSAAALCRARLGRTLLRSGQVPEGISYLESAVRKMKESIGPKHIRLVDVYKYLGAAYLMSRKSELAAQMFAAMKDIPGADSGAIETCDALSKAYVNMESSEVAVEKQKRVIFRLKRRGRNAGDELREAHRHLKQVLKRAHVASVVFAGLVMHFVLTDQQTAIKQSSSTLVGFKLDSVWFICSSLLILISVFMYVY